MRKRGRERNISVRENHQLDLELNWQPLALRDDTQTTAAPARTLKVGWFLFMLQPEVYSHNSSVFSPLLNCFQVAWNNMVFGYWVRCFKCVSVLIVILIWSLKLIDIFLYWTGKSRSQHLSWSVWPQFVHNGEGSSWSVFSIWTIEWCQCCLWSANWTITRICFCVFWENRWLKGGSFVFTVVTLNIFWCAWS